MAKNVKIYSTPTCPFCVRAKQFLKDNPDSAKKIEKALLQKLGLIPIAAVAPVAAPAKEKKVAKA